jgi:hypothetical protein
MNKIEIKIFMLHDVQPDNLGSIPIIDRDFTLVHSLQNKSAATQPLIE